MLVLFPVMVRGQLENAASAGTPEVRGLQGRWSERLWADWSPGYDASDDLPRVKDALRGADNLAAALGCYRATIGGVGQDPALADQQAATQQTPPQPTLYLHGRDDGCIGAELADDVDTMLAAGSRAEVLDGCGHFLHLERPADVNALILEFIKG